jgi:hypothetical protein
MFEPDVTSRLFNLLIALPDAISKALNLLIALPEAVSRLDNLLIAEPLATSKASNLVIAEPLATFNEPVVLSILFSLLIALPDAVSKLLNLLIALPDATSRALMRVMLEPDVISNEPNLLAALPVNVFNDDVAALKLVTTVLLDAVYEFSEADTAANCASVANVASSDELNDSKSDTRVENEPDHIDEEPRVLVKSTPFNMKEPVILALICFIYCCCFV